jgi:peroxiredoxin family protein
MQDNSAVNIEPSNKATVLLLSGELDKAIVAFEVACGMAAMGTQVNMWFIFLGLNVIKKPTGFFSRHRWGLSKKTAPGRNIKTDVGLQSVLKGLNYTGPDQLPLSQLNYFGCGPRLLRYLMRKKGSPSVLKLINDARELGVCFKICQPCVDVLALDVENDLIVDAEVSGVSSYVMDTRTSYYNGVF